MAQVFISHSAKDRRIIEFINRAFASTKVEAKYEEIEAILDGRKTAQQIRSLEEGRPASSRPLPDRPPLL